MNSDVLDNMSAVLAGRDRFKEDERMIWGLIPLSIKLSGKDTGGQLLIFEHNNMGKGGPPRHLHYRQDEWFYIIKGEFAFEVGEKSFYLKPGDTLFAPRNVPHGWAHISNQPGTLLTSLSPVGTFEEFILETTRHPNLPTPTEVEKAFADNDMIVVGPPLEVD